MDLSNAFEDGKTCLERMEERRKAGRVSEEEEASTMEALKERLREEYRKVNKQIKIEMVSEDVVYAPTAHSVTKQKSFSPSISKSSILKRVGIYNTEYRARTCE